MNATNRAHPAPAARRARDLLRDPAVWAWVVVALLAIFPAREALTRVRGDEALTLVRDDTAPRHAAGSQQRTGFLL
jgi:hypothetical protein